MNRKLITGLLIGGIIGVAAMIPALKKAPETTKYGRPFPFPHQYYKNTDEFYVFASGGQQGGLYVYGLPSMKLLAEVPIFNPDQAWGWTPEDARVKKMMTDPYTGELIHRGDTHHPAMSRTNGEYDGRWIFINDKMHGRVARVDLDRFRTGQVLWLPNIDGGIHGHAIGPNSKFIGTNFEHEQVPVKKIQKHLGVNIDPIKGPYVGGWAGIKIADDGEMSTEFEVFGPWTHDLARVGWGESDGWFVNTTYNIERALDTVGMFKDDLDYLYFWNIESVRKAIKAGKYTTTKEAPNTPVVSWKDVEVYMTPIPLNPHGVDISPSGRYMLTSGKATTFVVALDFRKIKAAIKAKKFEKTLQGVPVIAANDAREVTLDVGMGPTHIEFDDKGFAYIGFFVDSDTKKIPLGGDAQKLHGMEPWKVVDIMPAHYSVGHISIPGGDSAKPFGKYLVVMNKLAKDSFLPHGPLIAENHELWDISKIPAVMVDQAPMPPETHYSQAIPVEMIAKRVKFKYDDQKGRPVAKPGVKYDYANKKVTVNMDVVRSFFTPNWFSVPEGWKVKIHMTSKEAAMDISHGLAIDDYQISVSLDPGEIKDVEFVTKKTGVHWYYCIWFCSELHMEMRGRMIVIPKDQWSKSKEWKPAS